MLPDEPEHVISLVEEQLHVGRRHVVTDRFQVTTHVEERAVMIEDTVERGTLQVERVPLDVPVSEAPAPRQEGDTLIVSIVEERLVVEKTAVCDRGSPDHTPFDYRTHQHSRYRPHHAGNG